MCRIYCLFQAQKALLDLRGLSVGFFSGGTSSEAHCHVQLPCQSSFSHGHNDTANAQSRESGDTDGATEPGDIHLRRKDTTTDKVRALYTSNTFRLKCALVSAQDGLNVR